MDPVWLSFFGRLHPAVLHLPIGLFVGLALYESLAALRKKPPAPHSLVLLAALTGVLAAASGWRLHEEPGYGGELVEWHEWLGIGTAACGLFAWGAYALGRVRGYRQALGVTIVVLLPAAHLGASMTHGEDFLLEPFRTEEPAREPPAVEPADEPTSATSRATRASFAHDIAPILSARCTACHGTARQKGRLRLDTAEHVLAGGAGGPVVAPGDLEGSELFYRMALPAEDDDHMPPEGKPQPTPAELALVEAWIAAGAPMEEPFELGQTAASLPEQGAPQDVPGASAAPDADKTAHEPEERASPRALAALRERLVHVVPVTAGSAELWVDFAAPAVDITDEDVLELLAPIQAQVVELSLARTGISDELFTFVADMPSLQRLDLRDTAVGDTGVSRLGAHPRLAELVLVRTHLSDAAVDALLGLPALRKVWVWESGLSPDGVARLRSERPDLVVDAGDARLSAVLEAEPEPVLTGDAPLVDGSPPTGLEPINDACPVTGSPVDARYSVVFEGQVVGFCCPNCPKTLWEDPERFRAKPSADLPD